MHNMRRYSRRHILRSACVGTAALGFASQPASPAHAKPVDYRGLNSDQFLGDVEILAKVKDEKVFTEGPAVDAKIAAAAERLRSQGRKVYERVPKIVKPLASLSYVAAITELLEQLAALVFGRRVV